MKTELTAQELNIFHQLILKSNWNGEQVEIAVALKKKLELIMKEHSDLQLKVNKK